MNCPKCKAELVAKPKGISGKNNPYEAFWGHPRGSECKERIDMDEKTQAKVNLEARARKFDAEMTRQKSITKAGSANRALEAAKIIAPEIANLSNREDAKKALKKFVEEWEEWDYERLMNWWIKNIIEEK